MKRIWFVVAVWAIGVGAGARAQEAADDGGAVEPPAAVAVVSAEDEAWMRRVALDQLFRFALDWVRSPGDPRASDYSASANAMKVIERYTPGDEELLRFRISAHRAAGELDEVERATKKLVRMRPDDTVAQLRVLMMGIRERQDAGERMKLYDRLLGPRGAGLDVSIRSRLAFDAALLAREMGEEGLYRDRLLMAAEDRTNKEAAALFATEFLDRAESGLERVEILANLVTADPVDMGSLENLSRELMRHGAFAGAQRMWERTSDVLVNSGEGMSPQQLFEYHLGVWAMEGGEATLEPIEQSFHAQVLALRMEQEQMKEDKVSYDEDDEVLLPQALESVRLAVYLSQGRTVVEEEDVVTEEGGEEEDDGEEAEETAVNKRAHLSPAHASLDRIRTSLEQTYDTSARSDDIDEEGLRDVRVAVLLELTATRLWSGLELDAAEADLPELEGYAADGVIGGEAIERFRGVLAAQRGDQAGAGALLEPLATGDDTLARFGLCVAEERGGSAGVAAERYAAFARAAPETLLGGLARERAEALSGRSFDYGDDAREIDRYILDFAPWLDSMTASPRNFIDLRVESARTSLMPLERLEIELTLENVSRWPLAVGPGMPIHSRVLLVPSLRVEGTDIQLRSDGTINQQSLEILKPEVVELDRRIRLMPGEMITERVWVGKGGVGRMMDRGISLGATVRWRAVQGFLAKPEGGYKTGPNCVTTAGDVIRRSPAPRVIDDEDLAFRFRDAPPAELLVVMLQAREWLVDLAAGPDVDQLDINLNAGGISRAVEGRYGDMNEYLKTAAVSFLAPYGFFDNEGASGVLDLLLAEESDLVKLAVLSTYGPHVPDEYVRAIAEGDDEELAVLARLVVDRVGIEDEGFMIVQEGEEEPEAGMDSESAAEAAIEAALGGGSAPKEEEEEEDGGGGGG